MIILVLFILLNPCLYSSEIIELNQSNENCSSLIITFNHSAEFEKLDSKVVLLKQNEDGNWKRVHVAYLEKGKKRIQIKKLDSGIYRSLLTYNVVNVSRDSNSERNTSHESNHIKINCIENPITNISNEYIIHPSIVSDVIIIEVSEFDIKRSIIYDVTGRIVLDNIKDSRISVSTLPEGLYFIRIETIGKHPTNCN